MQGVRQIEGAIYHIDKSAIREMQRRAKAKGAVWVPKVDANTVCYELKERARYNPDTCVVYMDYDALVVTALSCLHEVYDNIIVILGDIIDGRIYNKYVTKIKGQVSTAQVFPRALSNLRLCHYPKHSLYDVVVFGAMSEWYADKDMDNISTIFVYGWSYTKGSVAYEELRGCSKKNVVIYDEDIKRAEYQAMGLNMQIYPMSGLYNFVYDYID